jgi:hypothetical protein
MTRKLMGGMVGGALMAGERGRSIVKNWFDDWMVAVHDEAAFSFV